MKTIYALQYALTLANEEFFNVKQAAIDAGFRGDDPIDMAREATDHIIDKLYVSDDEGVVERIDMGTRNGWSGGMATQVSNGSVKCVRLENGELRFSNKS